MSTPAADRWWLPPPCSMPGCPHNADGDLDGTPLCLDCVEPWLERAAAVHEFPALRETLPPLRYVPRHPSQTA